MLNGQQIEASVDEQAAIIASVAAGQTDREALTRWLATKVRGLGD